MRSVSTICLLASIANVHANTITESHTGLVGMANGSLGDSSYFMERLINQLASKLFDIALEPRFLHASDKDSLTIAKALSHLHGRSFTSYGKPVIRHISASLGVDSEPSHLCHKCVLGAAERRGVQAAATSANVADFLGARQRETFDKLESTQKDFRNSILPGFTLVKNEWWFDEQGGEPTTLRGKTAIVTGGSSGVGKEIARYLFNLGAAVLVTSRSLKRAQDAADDILKGGGRGRVEAWELDLSDLNSVREFVRKFLIEYNQLTFLVECAGEVVTPEKGPLVGPQGYEIHHASNYLGHFLLLHLLLPTMQDSVPARIAVVSSSANWGHNSDLDSLLPENKLNKKASVESLYEAYADSKFCQIAMAFELQKKFKQFGVRGLTITPVVPGLVTTGLNKEGIYPSFGPFEVSPKDGAMTTLHALLSYDMGSRTDVVIQPYLTPLLSFFKGSDLLPLALLSQPFTWCCHDWIRPNPDAYNEEFTEKLWEKSEAACGLKPIKFKDPDDGNRKKRRR